MLAAHNLSVEVGGRLVVEGATFTVRGGDKVGLVGRNGAGKTSMLKVVAGQAPAAGGVVLRRGALGFLTQEPGGDHEAQTTALQRVLSGRGIDEAVVRLEKLRLAVDETPTDRNVTRFARAEEAYRDAGGYAAEPEARRICAGLGLGADRLDLPFGVLSGGERRRVDLARILFAGSDLLLLDEPTNHLDNDAKEWLMSFLRSYRGALLVVSHDLALLDEAITRVLHLDQPDVVEYRGTYSQYRAARVVDERRAAKVAERRSQEIKRLSSLADTMRHQTEKRARIAKSLDKRVQRMRAEAAADAPVSRDRKARFHFPDPPHAGTVVLEAEGLTQAYGAAAPVFSDLAFDLGRGERLLVLGLNGAGKTSLLRILAGVTKARAGKIRLGAGVSAGYYAQEHEGIIAGVDVITHLREQRPGPAQELRALLGAFGLYGDVAFQDADTLSGGEKTKLALAQLVAGRHNLLLLDEPTNNLDPPSREGVARALAAWPGAMVAVSHDLAFVEALAPHRVLFMPEGTVDFWTDDLLELVALA
ncbi:MAG: ABC-F family ATP-binding cassette domain-containing protein [Acidimicrobiia bacterium]